MDAAELMRRILESGADRRGIDDRFSGNAELYASCFEEFMEEPNLALLAQSMHAKEYGRAFEAAHALKGIAGNLGVTAFYQAICVLVESLRANRYASVDAEYARVERELKKLKALLNDEAPAGRESAAASANGKRSQRKRDRFIHLFVAAIAVFIACVGFLFTSILGSYKTNTMGESAEHLVEICEQIRLYIEERIRADWKTADSVGDSITYSNFVDDDAAIFNIMQRLRERWQVTEIQLYTENGFSIGANGNVSSNAAASDIADRARDSGRYMAVIDSKIIYAIPVDTSLRYRGAEIVAVSVTQSMESFLKDMDFSSFGGQARMYLTEQNGIVLSRLTDETSPTVFSFRALMRQKKITVLAENVAAEELLSVQMPTVFIMADDARKDYAVSVPVQTEIAPLRLFYLAPLDVVNRTMNSFSQQLTALSLFVVLAIMVLAFMIFLFVYRNRKKQFDRALLARERMFDLLVQNTQTAFGLFTANQKSPDYLSGNSVKVIGEPCYALVKTNAGYQMRGEMGAESEAVVRMNDKMRDWDGKSEFRSGYLQKGGEAAPGYYSFQLYPADDGGDSFVGIMQDVTQTFERENATRTALAMAERANEAKSRFLSNMSHDIRTPMNTIVNMTAFARECVQQPEKLDGYLKMIGEASDHLLCLINDVLDMSRIESGQTVVGSAPFSLRKVLERQAALIRPLSEAKAQTFETVFEDVRTEAVLGDQLKFSQILLNLLGNAVKFTPEKGMIRFTAKEIPSLRENMVSVRCTVEDNGIGISQENLRHIFEPFSRANDQRVSGIEGTGLGLSICRGYVSAMGGVIHCQSEEGKGSVFTVELFFEKAGFVPSETGDAEVQVETPFAGMRCLLVEDNAINQFIARTMLERLGFAVDTANDGDEGVKKFLASAPGEYDVIYMDIRMPVMDGYLATKAIRESTHPRAGMVPIVAMTANVFAEDIEKARVAGMDGHLGKPLVSASLVEETSLAIRKRKEVKP